MSKVLQSILYVEDEADIQSIVKLALEVVAGIRVVACTSGSEAVQRGSEVDIDLILLDVMMPQMDGPTTLQRLRGIPALTKTPVVFMTAKAHPNEIAYFKSLGALDVIAKPFDPMTLAATLRQIWEQSQAEQIVDHENNQISRENKSSHENKNSATPEQSPEERFAARMAVLTAQFHSELPSRLSTLQQQWRALNETWSIDTLKALHNNTHNVAGSGATFGYDELTIRARAIDRQFKLLLDRTEIPDSNLRAELGVLFAALEAEFQRILAQLKN